MCGRLLGRRSSGGMGRESEMNAAAAGELGKGAYPVGVAARLAHIPPQTARRWIRGYDYPYKGGRRRSEPITFLAKPPHADDDLVDFRQLLTLMLVRTFLHTGLSLQTIKKAATRAQEKYGADNPFVTRGFQTDGNMVFLDLEEKGAVPGKERHMVDVLSDQQVFRSIVEPSLFEDVVFIDDVAGEWWPLHKARSVVVAPTRQFGAPYISGTGVRTDVLAQAFAAEGGDEDAAAAVADWFRVTPEQVRDAVDFEWRWLSTPLPN